MFISKNLPQYQQKQLPFFPSSKNDSIAQDNEIRLIDLFVDRLKLRDFGFTFYFVEHRVPVYQPSDLLKRSTYRYRNRMRMRSSRTLEKECSRNIELMWAGSRSQTIANFHKDNPKAIALVFRAALNLASHFELIGVLWSLVTAQNLEYKTRSIDFFERILLQLKSRIFTF
jgi:transposase